MGLSLREWLIAKRQSSRRCRDRVENADLGLRRKDAASLLLALAFAGGSHVTNRQNQACGFGVLLAFAAPPAKGQSALSPSRNLRVALIRLTTSGATAARCAWVRENPVLRRERSSSIERVGIRGGIVAEVEWEGNPFGEAGRISLTRLQFRTYTPLQFFFQSSNPKRIKINKNLLGL